MTPKRKHLIERYLKLYNEIEPYIDAACGSFSKGLRHITVEDLKQECALKLFEILSTKNRKIAEKKDGEIIKIFKKAVYNRLRDMYRLHKSEINHNLTSRGDSDVEFMKIDKLLNGELSPHDALVQKEYFNLVWHLLDEDIDRELLRLIVTPDDELMQIIFVEQKGYDSRRKKGEILFIGEEVFVRQKHYAIRLGTSEATITRVLKRIQSAILRVFRQ